MSFMFLLQNFGDIWSDRIICYLAICEYYGLSSKYNQ